MTTVKAKLVEEQNSKKLHIVIPNEYEPTANVPGGSEVGGLTAYVLRKKFTTAAMPGKLTRGWNVTLYQVRPPLPVDPERSIVKESQTPAMKMIQKRLS